MQESGEASHGTVRVPFFHLLVPVVTKPDLPFCQHKHSLQLMLVLLTTFVCSRHRSLTISSRDPIIDFQDKVDEIHMPMDEGLIYLYINAHLHCTKGGKISDLVCNFVFLASHCS